MNLEIFLILRKMYILYENDICSEIYFRSNV